MENVSGGSIMLDGISVDLKHLDKLYSINDNVLKVEIVDYYIKIAPFLLPHITDKPFCMIHFPEGAGGKSFYQKECPLNAPQWINTVNIESGTRGHIKWCTVNDTASIIYMVNRSVIEMHTWFSRLPDLDCPDIAVIDLDPGAGFDSARVIARAFGVLLRELNIYAVPKLSGGDGIHIYIPVKEETFSSVQVFLGVLCGIIRSSYPDLATTERRVKLRGGKVYLDAVQNARGKTIAAPYSLRAKQTLRAAMPLHWEELDDKRLNPLDFNIKNAMARLDWAGDLMEGLYNKAQRLPHI